MCTRTTEISAISRKMLSVAEKPITFASQLLENTTLGDHDRVWRNSQFIGHFLAVHAIQDNASKRTNGRRRKPPLNSR
jgi:hypothetical protein